MTESDRSVLSKYIGEVVIVLPDLQDPLEDEQQPTSDADVRYMGILADADGHVIELHPYFRIKRQTEADREREIARTLDPTLAVEETGLKARMTTGSASIASGKPRIGSMIRSPLIVPIAQCDCIEVYREVEPETEPPA